MRNTKHTPGPWKIETYHGPLFKIVREYDPSIGADCRTEADRRLIEAAPEMLEALEHVLKEFQHPSASLKQLELRDRIMDLIAKAKGGA